MNEYFEYINEKVCKLHIYYSLCSIEVVLFSAEFVCLKPLRIFKVWLDCHAKVSWTRAYVSHLAEVCVCICLHDNLKTLSK